MSTVMSSSAPAGGPDPARPAGRPRPAPTSSRRGSWFAPFWRWHFYASFLVVPVLVVLATTGLVYLFRFQLEPLLHPDLMRVEAASGTPLAGYEQQLGVVRASLDAEGLGDAAVVSLTEPLTPTSTTRVSTVLPDGSTRDYFVDPYEGTVLGSLDPDRTLSGTAVRLHADLMAGTVGDRVMELGTCWAIVMAITGYYLFLKGRRARRRVLQGALAGLTTGSSGAARAARDARGRQRHALAGAVVGVALLGMLVTGLPWTGVWGDTVQTLATRGGTSMWSLDHGAASDPTSTLDESLPHSHAQDVPWGLGEDEVPASDPALLTGDSRAVADADTAVLVAEQEGLRRPLTVVLPDGPEGVYSVISYAFDDPADEQTVHVDRYGGQVVSAYGYEDYPVLARVVSTGIALHEGRHSGPLNMAVSATVCLLVLVVCATGPLVWWRRRPRTGALGAPRARMPLRSTPVLAAGVVALGVLLPVFGVSLVVVLALDQLVLRRVAPLGAWFGVKP